MVEEYGYYDDMSGSATMSRTALSQWSRAAVPSIFFSSQAGQRTVGYMVGVSFPFFFTPCTTLTGTERQRQHQVPPP